MKNINMLRVRYFVILFFTLLFNSFADDAIINIAVASNFVPTLKAITKDKKNIHIISGSTAQLYEQIVLGAKYDIFLSADVTHIDLLAEKGFKSVPFTYAIGRAIIACNIRTIETAKRIAVANPKVAPYGEVAIEYFKSKNIYEQIKDKIAFTNNVATAYHYFESGSVDCAVMPKSFINKNITNYKEIESDIVQKGIIINEKNPNVKEFVEFLTSKETCEKLKKANYLC